MDENIKAATAKALSTQNAETQNAETQNAETQYVETLMKVAAQSKNIPSFVWQCETVSNGRLYIPPQTSTQLIPLRPGEASRAEQLFLMDFEKSEKQQAGDKKVMSFKRQAPNYADENWT